MSAVTRRLVLPTEGFWFEGHFPGDPILPGVAHLALVGRPLEGVISLRLRAPLAPGDAVEIEEEELDGGGRLRIAIRKGAEVASRGLLTPAREAAVLETPSDPETPGPGGEDVTSWIPHRPPILCLRGLHRADAREAVCPFRLPSEGAFVTGGSVPAFLALECAAQATAVWEAARRRHGGEDRSPRRGYLVGARDARFAAPRFPAGTRGTVRIRLEGKAPPLAIYGFSLERRERTIAAGTIQVWITPTAA